MPLRQLALESLLDLSRLRCPSLPLYTSSAKYPMTFEASRPPPCNGLKG